MKTKSFLRSYGLAVVLICGIIGLLLGLAITKSSWASEANRMKARIDSVETEIQQSERRVETAQNLVRIKATGMDSNHKSNDDTTAETLFRTAFSWDSLETYTVARNRLLAEYDYLGTDCMFFESYMPDPELFILYDESGAPVNDPFRDGRNVSFVSMQSHVTDIKDNAYRYFTIIRLQSKGTMGGTSYADVIAVYWADGNGKLSDLYVSGISF